MARSHRDAAVATVVKAEVGPVLVAQFDDALARLAEAAAVLTALGPMRLPNDHHSQNWSMRITDLPSQPHSPAAKAAAAGWATAIAALTEDAAAPLPMVEPPAAEAA